MHNVQVLRNFAHIFERMLSLKIFFTEKKYFAPAFMYTCFALVFSTWIVYIPWKPILLIAMIAMVMMASEGAIADWSSLYMKEVVIVRAELWGLAYALFAVGMAIGRFMGDAMSLRFGSWRLLSMAVLTSIVGFALVLSTVSVIVFCGFLIIGLGFSVVVPEIYRLASNVDGIRPADGISMIAASSNIGFLTGPVILGFVAELYSLYASFLVLTGFVVIAFVLVSLKKRR